MTDDPFGAKQFENQDAVGGADRIFQFGETRLAAMVVPAAESCRSGWARKRRMD